MSDGAHYRIELDVILWHAFLLFPMMVDFLQSNLFCRESLPSWGFPIHFVLSGSLEFEENIEWAENLSSSVLALWELQNLSENEAPWIKDSYNEGVHNYSL